MLMLGVQIIEGSDLEQQQVRIGCAGWNVPRQSAANFLSDGSHLERYSQTLNACEINSSFYREHKRTTWERWAGSVPAEFRFSVKVSRAITHETKLNCNPDVLSAFLQQTYWLDGKLGPLLIQLPPSLEFEHGSASAFMSLLRRSYSGDVAWEPRHRSWFVDRVDGLLKEYQIARVAADPGCVPAAAEPGGLSSLAYFRLHGSPRRYYSGYSKEFLQRLSSKLQQLASSSIWCIFDNTASGAAVQNALELSATLRTSPLP
jgi:uncharacterized protein YecE (DUF72 family)